MRILLSYLLHDMLAKYRRTLLVLVTLTLAASSVLASAALSDTMVRLGTSQWRAENGYSDILITATPASPSRFFNEYAADRFSSLFEYTVLRVSSVADMESPSEKLSVSAKGYNLSELMKMTGMELHSQKNLFPFEGNKAIISMKTAQEHGIALGDIVMLDISGNRHALEVCAIAYAQGPFVGETDMPVVMLPYDKMQACIGQLGHVDAIFAKLKDPEDKGRAIRLLSGAYEGCKVGESFSEDNLRLQANRTAVPFVFMSVLLCFMAAYVLFTFFQGTAADRLPLMGLFRAIGATTRETGIVMLTESLIYGLLGGLCGCAAGAGMLSLIIRTLNGVQDYQFFSPAIGLPQMSLTLVSAVGTSLVGAASCLASARNASICGQIKGLTAARAPGARGLPWGVGILAVSLAVVLFWQSENGLAIYIACVVGMMAGSVLLSPALCRWAAHLLSAGLRRLSGPVRIAALGIQGRGDFTVATTIISIIVCTVIVISSISFSDRTGAALHWARMRYSIELTMPGLDKHALNLVRQVEGVDGVCGNYCSSTVEVGGQAIPLYRVQGVTAEHREFVDYQVASPFPDPLAALDGGRNMLLTSTMQQIYHVKQGDSLLLKLFGRDGKYREVRYTIIGFFDDFYTKLGRIALISQQNFRDDFAAGDYDSLYILSSHARAAAEALQAALANRQAAIRLVEDDRGEADQESARIIGAMSFISDLAVATGILGIINITLLSFLRRRREIGLYYALGMTRRDILRVTAAEQLLSGLMGCAAGTVMGLAVTALALPRLIFSLQIAMRIYTDIRAFGMGLPVGLLASVASSALCVLFIRKNNPMDGLRLEE